MLVKEITCNIVVGLIRNENVKETMMLISTIYLKEFLRWERKEVLMHQRRMHRNIRTSLSAAPGLLAETEAALQVILEPIFLPT